MVGWLSTTDLPAGVEVIAVSTSVTEDADNYPPSAWFKRTEWPTTVLLDSPQGEIASIHGLPGFPYWVAVDSSGEVVARVSGRIGEAQFRELLAAVTPAA